MNLQQRQALLARAQALVDMTSAESRAFNQAEHDEFERTVASIRLGDLGNAGDYQRHTVPLHGMPTLGGAAQGIADALRTTHSTRQVLATSIRAIVSGASGSDFVPSVPQHMGLLSMYQRPSTRLIELLPSIPATSGSMDWVEINYNDGGSPPAARSAAAKVTEGSAKPQSHISTTPVSVSIPTWAHWMDVSRQVLADVPALRGILDSLLTDGLLDNVDEGIYDNLTTGGHYTPFTPTASESIGDGAARIAAKIVNAGGRNVVVAINPDDYLSMQLAKADSSGVYLGLPPTLAATVVAVPAVESGKLLAFAPGSGAAWADRDGVAVVAGLKNDDLTRNLMTLLCEARGEVLRYNVKHVAFGDAQA